MRKEKNTRTRRENDGDGKVAVCSGINKQGQNLQILHGPLKIKRKNLYENIRINGIKLELSEVKLKRGILELNKEKEWIFELNNGLK